MWTYVSEISYTHGQGHCPGVCEVSGRYMEKQKTFPCPPIPGRANGRVHAAETATTLCVPGELRHAIPRPSLGRFARFFFQKTQLAQTQLSVAKLFKSRQPFVSYSHSRPSTTLKRPVPQMQDLYMRERLRSGQILVSADPACQTPHRHGGLPQGSLRCFIAS